MAKPIPYNPNIRKVTPSQKPAEKEIRVVVVSPAAKPPIIPPKPKAAPDSRTGRKILNRILHPRQSGTDGGKH
jgi:hypothetical protein